MPHLTIPAKALTGRGNNTRAFLTEREVVKLVTADGYTPRDIADLLAYNDGGSFGLSTGAKVARVLPFQIGKVSGTTRARSWQVYGYHYAGTDVTQLVQAVA